MNDSTAVRHLFVTGLKNAHAVEHQALTLMDNQIAHLARYAEMEQKLRIHRGETEQQIARIERILEGLAESPSTLKDMAMSTSGALASLGHMFAPDEVIKNSLANYAFENFEVATYRSLITIARIGGYEQALPLLEESLHEEEVMARFIGDMLPAVVDRYISLRSAGEQASH